MSKSGGNKGHFTLEAETGFHPYLDLHNSGMTQKSQVAIHHHQPQQEQVWSKSGTKEEHVALQAITVSRPYLASHCSGVSKISQMELSPHAPKLLKA
jgi:hypothetical protein